MRPKASIETLKLRLLEKSIPEPNTGCWLWTASHKSNGYGYMWGGSKKEHSHRLSYSLFKGAIPSVMFVLHRCDQPACINPDHLFVGTQSDNLNDCVKKGRHRPASLKGEVNHKSKLTDLDVEAIRSATKKPRYLYELSEKYGVSRGSICAVRNGRTWKHLT